LASPLAAAATYLLLLCPARNRHRGRVAHSGTVSCASAQALLPGGKRLGIQEEESQEEASCCQETSFQEGDGAGSVVFRRSSRTSSATTGWTRLFLVVSATSFSALFPESIES